MLVITGWIDCRNQQNKQEVLNKRSSAFCLFCFCFFFHVNPRNGLRNTKLLSCIWDQLRDLQRSQRRSHPGLLCMWGFTDGFAYTGHLHEKVRCVCYGIKSQAAFTYLIVQSCGLFYLFFFLLSFFLLSCVCPFLCLSLSLPFSAFLKKLLQFQHWLCQDT